MIPYMAALSKITCLQSVPLDIDYNDCPSPGEGQKLAALEVLNTLLTDTLIATLEQPLIYLDQTGNYCCKWNTSEMEFEVVIFENVFQWNAKAKNSDKNQFNGVCYDSYELRDKFRNLFKKLL